MKHTRHLISLAFAALAIFCAADVTRDTEWQDVPPGTRVGTVVDLGQGGGGGGGGGTDTNAVQSIIQRNIDTNLLLSASATNGLRRVTDMDVYEYVVGEWDFSEQMASAAVEFYDYYVTTNFLGGDVQKYEFQMFYYYGGTRHGGDRSVATYDSVEEMASVTSITWRAGLIFGGTKTTRFIGYQAVDRLATTSSVPVRVGQLANDAGYIETNEVETVAKNIAESASVTNAGAVAAAQAMTNDWEGVGTYRQIVRGQKYGYIWDITVSWYSIEETPDTLDAYGITDAYTKTESDAVVSNNLDYALRDLSGTSVSLASGEIGSVEMTADTTVSLDFSTAANRSGDCLLYAINATDSDHDIKPATNGYTVVSADLAKALTIGKHTTNVVMFTRLRSDTILISKQEVK